MPALVGSLWQPVFFLCGEGLLKCSLFCRWMTVILSLPSSGLSTGESGDYKGSWLLFGKIHCG